MYPRSVRRAGDGSSFVQFYFVVHVQAKTSCLSGVSKGHRRRDVVGTTPPPLVEVLSFQFEFYSRWKFFYIAECKLNVTDKRPALHEKDRKSVV